MPSPKQWPPCRNDLTVNDPQLNPLFALLSGKFGWLPTAITYYTAFTTACGLIQLRWQRFLERNMAFFAAQPGSSNDALFTALLNKRWYQIATFLCRFINLWLPTIDDYTKEKNHFRAVARIPGARMPQNSEAKPQNPT